MVAGWAQQSRSSGLFSGRQNQELTDYTRGMYDARALAMERLTREAHRLHAHGVVGVTIDRGEHSRERDAGGMTFRDLIIELHVLGTAIVEVRHDAPPPAAVHRPTTGPGGPMSDEQEPYDPTSLAGVPEHGRERLERMRDRSLFTSDLTVNEFLLVRAAGFEPLGLVVGTSIYHIGFQMGAWSRTRRWTSSRRRCTTPASSR